MRHREFVHSHEKMLRQAKLHLHVGNLLEDLRVCQMAGQVSKIMTNDIVAFESPMVSRKQPFDWALHAGLFEWIDARRQLIPHLPPPTDRATPEQFLA